MKDLLGRLVLFEILDVDKDGTISPADLVYFIGGRNLKTGDRVKYIPFNSI